MLRLLASVLNIAKDTLQLTLDAPIYTTLTHIRDEDVEVPSTLVDQVGVDSLGFRLSQVSPPPKG